MTNSVKAHVAGVMTTFQGGPGIFAAPKTFNPVQAPPLGPIIGTPSTPMAGGGGGGTAPGSKAAASDPNKSSSLSESGDIDPEKLDDDIDKIKQIEKEIQAKEEAQKAEKKRLDDEEATLLEGKQTELDEKQKKLKEEQKVTAEQRKQLDEVIAPPFAVKNDNGTIKKDEKGNIKFLDKDSEELKQLKQELKIKNPETIKDVKKALEIFNEYRKANPIKEEGLETINGNTSASVQKQTGMPGPSRYANAFNTLDFEEANV